MCLHGPANFDKWNSSQIKASTFISCEKPMQMSFLGRNFIYSGIYVTKHAAQQSAIVGVFSC